MITAVRRSPLARGQLALGAVVSHEAGWEVTESFGDERAERQLLLGSVGMADVTPRAKVDVRGGIDDAFLPADGASVARVASDWGLVLARPGAEAELAPAMEAAAAPGTMVTDATHLYCGIAIAGPAVSDSLARLTSWDPRTLANGSATAAPIADVPAIVVRRDLTVLLFELYVATESGRYVWETILEVVRPLGGGPIGWTALRSEGWR